MPTPMSGYDLPDWNRTNADAYTAKQYMKSHKVWTVENLNGKTYTWHQIKKAVLKYF